MSQICNLQEVASLIKVQNVKKSKPTVALCPSVKVFFIAFIVRHSNDDDLKGDVLRGRNIGEDSYSNSIGGDGKVFVH